MGRNASKFTIGKYHINIIEETSDENCGFCVEKEREKKTRMTKVVKSCDQVTWTQKSVTKKRVRFLRFP